MKYYVYILRCSDKSLYTGITTNIERRTKEHNGLINKKVGSKYTTIRRPVDLVYSILLKNRSDALKEEIRIKKLKKSDKEKLIYN